MKKGWLICFALIAMGLFFFWCVNRDGPSYEGKTAEQWFRQYYSSGSQGRWNDIDRLEAKLAMAHFGSSAITYLNDEARHPRPDTVPARINHELHRLLTREALGPYVNGTNIAFEASMLIKELKPSASVIFPLVANALQHPEDVMEYRGAIWMLGCVGDGAEQGVPALAQALRDTNAWTGNMAAQSLMYLGHKAKGALPAIVECLQQKTTSPNLYSLLTSLGEDAKAALPFLDQKLASTNESERIRVAAAICSIDPNRRDALEIIQKHLVDGAALQRQALWSVRQIGPAARAAIPAILEIINASTNNNAMQAAALGALETISLEETVRVLHGRMSSTHPIEVQLWAAGWILRINPKDAEAIAFLKQELTKASPNATWEAYAIEQLGEVSPDEKEMMGLLEKYSLSRDESTRLVAKKALKKIRLKEKQPLEK